MNQTCRLIVSASFLLYLSCLPVWSQEGSGSVSDSFSSTTSDQGSPSYSDIFSNDSPRDPGPTQDEVTRAIDTFANSLPNDPKVLMGMLDRLLRQRLDHWHYPNLSKLGIWTGYCHAILDKAAASNQKKEYQNSFHNRNPQEMRRTLDQNKQINDCWYAWLEAFSEVLRLLPHNAWEETEPTSSEHKAEALRAIEKAEATCRFHAVPGLTPPGHMPPLAPQRPSSGQLTGTGKQPGSSSSTKPGTPPRVLQGHTSVDVARHAHELGENHPDWWKNEGKDHQIRKCNLFADRVFRDLQIPLPWDGQSTPTVQGMLPKLANSNDWSLVYSDDKPFGTYVPQPGDFALWNKTIVSRTYSGGTLRTPLQHCGIIGTDGEIMYAGSGVTGGYAESDFNLMRAAATYGAPTAIYRSTHLDH